MSSTDRPSCWILRLLEEINECACALTNHKRDLRPFPDAVDIEVAMQANILYLVYQYKLY